MVEAAGVGLDIVFKIGGVLRFRNEIDSPETPDSLKRPGEPPNRPQKFGAAIGERRPHPRPVEAVRILSSRTAKSPGFSTSICRRCRGRRQHWGSTGHLIVDRLSVSP